MNSFRKNGLYLLSKDTGRASPCGVLFCECIAGKLFKLIESVLYLLYVGFETGVRISNMIAGGGDFAIDHEAVKRGGGADTYVADAVGEIGAIIDVGGSRRPLRRDEWVSFVICVLRNVERGSVKGADAQVGLAYVIQRGMGGNNVASEFGVAVELHVEAAGSCVHDGADGALTDARECDIGIDRIGRDGCTVEQVKSVVLDIRRIVV